MKGEKKMSFNPEKLEFEIKNPFPRLVVSSPFCVVSPNKCKNKPHHEIK